MPVFPAIFERVAGNLLSVDGSATQLPAILLAILLGVDAPLYILYVNIRFTRFDLLYGGHSKLVRWKDKMASITTEGYINQFLIGWKRYPTEYLD